MLIAGPTPFYGVQVLGADERARRRTHRGNKFVTVIINLTPVRDGTAGGYFDARGSVAR